MIQQCNLPNHHRFWCLFLSQFHPNKMTQSFQRTSKNQPKTNSQNHTVSICYWLRVTHITHLNSLFVGSRPVAWSCCTLMSSCCTSQLSPPYLENPPTKKCPKNVAVFVLRLSYNIVLEQSDENTMASMKNRWDTYLRKFENFTSGNRHRFRK